MATNLQAESHDLREVQMRRYLLRQQLLAAVTDNPDLVVQPTADQLAFHQSGAQGRVISGGNRSGKTWCGAREAMWWLLGTHPYRDTPKPPIAGRVVAAERMQLGREDPVPPTRAMMAYWLPRGTLRGNHWDKAYSATSNVLHLTNGSILEFMSHDQADKAQAGDKRHFVWWDEEPPRSKFDEGLMRLLDESGAWWMTYTPAEGMTWSYFDLYEPWSHGDTPSLDWIILETEDNPTLSPATLANLRELMGDEVLRARLKGQFVTFGGLIYPQWEREKHVWPEDEPLPFDLRDVPTFAVIDPGIGAPTAVVWFAIDKDGHLWAFDIYYEKDRVIAQVAEAILATNSRYKITPRYLIDPAASQRTLESGRSVQMLYAEQGVSAAPAAKAWQPRVDQVREYLRQEKFHMLSSLRPLEREFMSYRRSKRWAAMVGDPSGRPLTEGDDHALDCVGYMCMARPLPAKPIAPKPGPFAYETLVRQYRGGDPAFLKPVHEATT